MMDCSQCPTRSTCTELCPAALGFLEGTTKASREIPCTLARITNPEPLTVPTTEYIKTGKTPEEELALKKERNEKMKSFEDMMTPREKTIMFLENSTRWNMDQEEKARGVGLSARQYRRHLRKLEKKLDKK